MPFVDPPATVFIVDDDQGLLRLIQKTLRREGFTVVHAASGKEAIAWLTDNQADLMLLDLKLHDIEGKELVNHLASINRSVPFVVITGQGDERAAVDMMKRGALDYLVKDVDFLQFVPEMVRRALAQVAREKRLAEAEEQARLGQTVLDQGFSAVIITRREPGDPLVVYVNAAFSQLTGFLPDDAVGRPLSHLENLTGPMPEFHKALSAQQPFSGQGVIRHKNNQQHLVERHISPVLNPAGLCTHWVVIQRDLTQIKRLEKEILEISEREQRRIGQDLHDGLGQQLTGIELMCESLRSDLATVQPDLERQAKKICRFLRETVAQTRSLAHGLAPFKVETEGLETALRELAQSTTALGRLKCSLRCISPVIVPNRETAGHLYRIAQEAINNAVKHSKATEVIIDLSGKNGTLRLQVRDNGSGLPKKPGERQGIGLSVMKHRASLIGADLEVDSQLAKGLTITCTLRRTD